MNSSRKRADNTLAAFTPDKLQTFLSEIANLNDAPESAARLARRFADFELFTVPFRAFGPAPGHEKDEERKWLLLLRDRALDFLLKWHYKARYCGNPDCPAHYFFGTRTNQQFCSEFCAEHGQREAKRRWWAEHGADWRKQQTNAAASSRVLKKTNKKARRGK